MDYGHTDNQTKGAFFTSGAVTSSENANNFESENNLDLSNDAASWGTNPERDHRSMGNKVIESGSEEGQGDLDELSSGPELGKIIDLSMPPGVEGEIKEDPSKIIEASFDRTVIKTDDKLSSSAVKEIDTAIANLDRDGDISKFYGMVRDAMEANLDNSYGRKLAA